MIKTRIASTAAIFTFGLAALGGTVMGIAAPANAEPRLHLIVEQLIPVDGWQAQHAGHHLAVGHEQHALDG